MPLGGMSELPKNKKPYCKYSRVFLEVWGGFEPPYKVLQTSA